MNIKELEDFLKSQAYDDWSIDEDFKTFTIYNEDEDPSSIEEDLKNAGLYKNVIHEESDEAGFIDREAYEHTFRWI